MHKSVVLLAALAASAFIAEPAWAKIIRFEASVSQVRAGCSKAGGTFGVHIDGGGYGCTKANCDGKGGNCQVQCNNNNQCTGSTPGRVQPTGSVLGILIPSAKPSKPGGVLGTGLLEGGAVLGTQGPATAGTPVRPTAPSAPPVIIR
jgi:hypothetical protein